MDFSSTTHKFRKAHISFLLKKIKSNTGEVLSQSFLLSTTQQILKIPLKQTKKGDQNQAFYNSSNLSQGIWRTSLSQNGKVLKHLSPNHVHFSTTNDVFRNHVCFFKLLTITIWECVSCSNIWQLNVIMSKTLNMLCLINSAVGYVCT